MTQESAPPADIQVHIDESIAGGTYSNLVLVSQSETEFTLDFVYVQPNSPSAMVKARVLLNPKQAKRLASALVEQMAEHEQSHGTVVLGDSLTMAG